MACRRIAFASGAAIARMPERIGTTVAQVRPDARRVPRGMRDEALERLAMVDERLNQVVECRYFGGLTEAETAEALGITVRTVQRDWRKARDWLAPELGS